MELDVFEKKPHEVETDVLGLFLHQDEDIPYRFKTLDNKLNNQITKAIENENFKGELNETFAIPSLGNLPADEVLLVGIGKKKEYETDNIRQASATALQYAKSVDSKKFSIYIGTLFSVDTFSQFAVEGAVLGNYKFDKYINLEDENEEKEIEELQVACPGKLKKIKKAAEKGKILAEATNYTRNLQDLPANVATPKYLAKEAKNLSDLDNVKVEILSKSGLKKKNMNLILAVSSGSGKEPKTAIMEYKGGKKGPIVLVGKGVTFDAGGLDIKPTSAMNNMHYDKCGAMAVFGIMKAAAELELPIHLIGITPLTENLTGADAQKPRDIVESHSGKTIEVKNTDAEGRLIMADSLSYSEKYDPEAVIDMATLTGSCIKALGYVAAGLLGNNKEFLSKVKDAAEQTSEKVWELPLWDEYREQMDSDVADVKNIGEEHAGTSTAAAFLEKFVPEHVKWAHLDIAGTAYVEKMKNPKPYASSGATGFGVRLVTQVLEDW